MLMRLELLTPQGDLVDYDTYNKLFTMHGIIMVFFFLVPSIPATLGNFLVPIMIGAQRSGLSADQFVELVHLHLVGAIFTLFAVVLGGVDTGWTFYTPFSTTYSNTFVILPPRGRLCLGLLVDSDRVNFIVTVHRCALPE